MRIFLTLTLFLIIAASPINAAVPTAMNYQGLLTDAGGDPVADDSYSAVFTIYDAASGGTSVWTETQNVTTTNGLFAVLLGSVNPVLDTVFNGTTRYLGIAVAGDSELSPRTAMVSVPYAQRVSTVDGASGGNITSKISIGPGHTNTGSYTFVAGRNNEASENYSTVGGGFRNRATGLYSVVAGGGGGLGADGNSALADHSTVSGGNRNSASGEYSAIPGGYYNVADGPYSFAAGRFAEANHSGCFVWADHQFEYFTSTAEDQFLIRASGGIGINNTSPIATVDISVPPGMGSGLHFDDGFQDITWNPGQRLQLGEWDGTTFTERARFNPAGNFGIGTNSPTERLTVSGNICYTGTIGACSDARYKTDIKAIPNSLDRVMRMRGIRYKWKQDEYPEQNFDDKVHLGFIAQEVEKLYPEMLLTDENGYMSLDYGRLTPVLVEAIKEQQKQIDELKVLVYQLANRSKELSDTQFGLK